MREHRTWPARGVWHSTPQSSECVKATEQRVLPRTHTQALNSPSPVFTKFPVWGQVCLCGGVVGGKDASLQVQELTPLGPPQPSGFFFEHGQSKRCNLATLPSSPGHTGLTFSFSLTPEPCSPALNALLPQFCTSKHHPRPGTLPSVWLGTYSVPGMLHSSSLQPGHTVQRSSPPILPWCLCQHVDFIFLTCP